ncbi:MAG: terpene cyclase/mutase family protein [Candidatus Nomurabacteria bacterium]|nr:terpene cyclase/mutase family protein [Candidatus Nomurabacteria bacterium]
MKNKIKVSFVLFCLSFVLLGHNFVLADDIQNFSITKNISLPDNCSIKDTNDKTHIFPEESSSSKFLGICALEEAKKQGAIDDFKIVEYPFGLFIDSINNLKSDTSYWALYLNDIYEERGLTILPLLSGDKMSLVYVDFNNVELGSRVDIHIDELTPSPEKRTSGSSGSYIRGFIPQIVTEKVFSVENALKFLEINQKSDGSYSAPMYTDWVAVAIGAGDDKEIKSKLINYLKENGIDSSVVTDNERHAMALMSLGIDPYTGTKVNYIKKITDSFDGIQFGDKTLVNDDIFALIVLKNAGYSINDELIIKDLNYIISKQGEDGSWGSIDMTAAGIQALKSFENISGVNDAILKAEKYITTNQKIDGGFENSSSTSWVLQILSENKEILKTEGYLASKQEADGGMESVGTDLNTRIWATAYAIPAILYKPWGAILNNFPKPDISTLTLNKNEIIKQNRKVTSKIFNINNGEVIKNGEDRRKIENIIDSNGEVKINKPSNIWRVFKAPFSWLLGKLGF